MSTYHILPKLAVLTILAISSCQNERYSEVSLKFYGSVDGKRSRQIMHVPAVNVTVIDWQEQSFHISSAAVSDSITKYFMYNPATNAHIDVLVNNCLSHQVSIVPPACASVYKSTLPMLLIRKTDSKPFDTLNFIVKHNNIDSNIITTISRNAKQIPNKSAPSKL
jgi:hypothetical protein